MTLQDFYTKILLFNIISGLLCQLNLLFYIFFNIFFTREVDRSLYKDITDESYGSP